jgi:hypothetical protein
MSKVQTQQAGEVEVKGGKEIIAENIPGFVDGEKITAFSLNERCNFKIEYAKDFKGTKHLPDGTVIDMHVLDAAIAEKIGKGKIVK